MSESRCDSGHSGKEGTTSCTHCNNLGLVNGEILVAYDPILKKPEVKKFKCKYCGHTQNVIFPYNLSITQAQWNAYMAM